METLPPLVVGPSRICTPMYQVQYYNFTVFFRFCKWGGRLVRQALMWRRGFRACIFLTDPLFKSIFSTVTPGVFHQSRNSLKKIARSETFASTKFLLLYCLVHTRCCVAVLVLDTEQWVYDMFPSVTGAAGKQGYGTMELSRGSPNRRK